MVTFSVSYPGASNTPWTPSTSDIAVSGLGYSQSTPAYILGGNAGTTQGRSVNAQSTPSHILNNQPVSTPTTTSAFQSWLSGLQTVLSNLSNTLKSWSSPSGGASGGGGVGGGSAGSAGGGSVGGYYSAYSPPTPPALAQGNIVNPAITTPAIYESGLASFLPSEKEELNRKQQTLASLVQPGNFPSIFPGIVLRTNLWDTIKKQISAQPKSYVSSLGTLQPTTGTTKPDTKVQNDILSSLYEMSNRSQGINMASLNREETITNAGNIKEAPPPVFDKVVTETTNQFADLQNALNDISVQLQKAREEADTLTKEGKTTDEEWIQKWMDSFTAMRDTYYNKLTPLSTQIDDIDKVLLQAQEGFRKTAEDIRNNPDLTVWQQARRLKELEDMQNYAPIFNGLSYKDLVEYRKILADTLNKYIDAYNDTMNMASDFAVNVEQLKIQKSNKEYQGLSDVLGLSQKILDLQRSLSSYGYSQFEYTDTRTGEKHVGVQYEDPRTHKITVVSDTIIGKTAPSSASSTQSIDTLSLLMKEIYPRISQAVSLKTPLSADDYYNLLARWHSVAGNKYDSEFDKFLKNYGVHLSSGGLGPNPF